MPRIVRSTAVLAVLAAGLALLAGCGASHASESATTSGKSATAPQAPARAAGHVDTSCRTVPAGLARRILAHTVLKDATLTKAAAVQAATTPGYYYVSTAVKGGGAKGDSLATWVTKGLDRSTEIYAVDSFAALISTFGASTDKSPYLAITAPGAYRSRVCVGGRSASHGIPAPAGGGGNHPASG